MATRRDIIPPGMENIFERFHYAPGVLVDDTLYIAGQVGRNERLEVVQGTEAQFVQAFENVKKVLSAAGASFDDVVEMVTYHVDMRDLALFMQVKDRYYTGRVPAWTGVGVTALAMPGLVVEIKCVARLGHA
ncbi:MAG: RidA family protein [Gammaproteobacteria bacterium]|nr:RidA family protein [Gammaproteobacteria bacterium]MCP5202206.1 RidA family protein [Gammaproteobacteria bacterium]